MTSAPSFDVLMQPTLNALHALGGSASGTEITHHVIQELSLPVEIVNQPHGNSDTSNHQSELEYRLMWSRTYLKKVGLVANPQRGVWQLTATGFATKTVDYAAIVKQVQQQMKAKQDSEAEGVSLNESSETLAADLTMIAVTSATNSDKRSPTPHLPTYSQVRHYLQTMDGVSYTLYRVMYSDIWAQRGNPQEQEDWSDPDVWILQRLQGKQRELAMRIWQDSKRTVNPRYTRGAWYLVSNHGLLSRQEPDVLRMTQRGHHFLKEPGGSVEAEIDSYEGLLTILRIVSERGPGRRREFVADYADFCRAYTTYESENVIKSSLYDRLMNLIDRGFVSRSGQQYGVTDTGLGYLNQYAHLTSGVVRLREQQSDIWKISKDMRDAARRQLAEHLAEMNPFKFEQLVKLLLEEIGYDNVRTTSPTNDKGVDIVADIELGISSVREVIQVKRHKGNVNRVVLDQLRGSLHRFDAVRGTVITTGRFSKGVQQAAFERGAAPITLIDGEKLLDLLMENQIGVSKKAIDYYEFDPTKLLQFEDDDVGGAPVQ